MPNKHPRGGYVATKQQKWGRHKMLQWEECTPMGSALQGRQAGRHIHKTQWLSILHSVGGQIWSAGPNQEMLLVTNPGPRTKLPTISMRASHRGRTHAPCQSLHRCMDARWAATLLLHSGSLNVEVWPCAGVMV
jgi:hypothetical protein